MSSPWHWVTLGRSHHLGREVRTGEHLARVIGEDGELVTIELTDGSTEKVAQDAVDWSDPRDPPPAFAGALPKPLQPREAMATTTKKNVRAKLPKAVEGATYSHALRDGGEVRVKVTVNKVGFIVFRVTAPRECKGDHATISAAARSVAGCETNGWKYFRVPAKDRAAITKAIEAHKNAA